MNTRDRAHQVLRWLVDVFPPPRGMAVRLRVVRKMPKAYADCLGVCVWSADETDCLIWLKHERRVVLIPTLLHEYTHILTEGRGESGGHGEEFYISLGEVEREFYSRGASDSGTY